MGNTCCRENKVVVYESADDAVTTGRASASQQTARSGRALAATSTTSPVAAAAQTSTNSSATTSRYETAASASAVPVPAESSEPSPLIPVTACASETATAATLSLMLGSTTTIGTAASAPLLVLCPGSRTDKNELPFSQLRLVGHLGSSSSSRTDSATTVTPRSGYSGRMTPQNGETLPPLHQPPAVSCSAGASFSSDSGGFRDGDEIAHTRVRDSQTTTQPPPDLAATATPLSMQDFLFPHTVLVESEAGSTRSLLGSAQQQQQPQQPPLLRDRFADDENRSSNNNCDSSIAILGSSVSTRHVMSFSTQDMAASGTSGSSFTPASMLLRRVESDTGAVALSLGPEQPRERHSMQHIVILSAVQSEGSSAHNNTQVVAAPKAAEFADFFLPLGAPAMD